MKKKKKRLFRSKKYILWSKVQWNPEIFSNECKLAYIDLTLYGLFEDIKVKDFIQITNCEVPSKPISVGLTSSMEAGKINFLKGNVNEFVYADILEKSLKPTIRVNFSVTKKDVFQYDLQPAIW